MRAQSLNGVVNDLALYKCDGNPNFVAPTNNNTHTTNTRRARRWVGGNEIRKIRCEACRGG
jgi:hypothetical protein